MEIVRALGHFMMAVAFVAMAIVACADRAEAGDIIAATAFLVIGAAAAFRHLAMFGLISGQAISKC
ncbi:hypothetical protein [Sphingomonas japonica]|uniref:Lipoprotein n=1 Tax=Sphingomonas japonica TaxID=511662 RepID=A0ABX0U629_9SPHN|nr:hypothetical protein [Sphingomonas japonica]NIJ24851.1 hypothetical protein [Sphingomonas japonica]